MKFFRLALPAALSMGMALASCSNELNVNDPWSDITVVYALLDASQDTNWVRINRAYLGTQGVDAGAQEPDSIYYGVLEVWLDEYNGNSLVRSFQLDYDDSSRDLNDGFFTTEGYHLYRTTEDVQVGRNYKLRIVKGDNVPVVTAEAIVLGNDVDWISPRNNALPLTLVPNTDYSVTFETQELAKVFEVSITARYKEYTVGDEANVRFLESVYTLPVKSVTNLNGGVTLIFGYTTETLLGALMQNIPVDPNARRFLLGMDFKALAGDEDLYTYLSVNQPPTGIVTERPDFSNIEGGYGLFGSRSLAVVPNKQFNEAGMIEFVVNDMSCDRNFGRIFTTPGGQDTCFCTGNRQCN